MGGLPPVGQASGSIVDRLSGVASGRISRPDSGGVGKSRWSSRRPRSFPQDGSAVGIGGVEMGGGSSTQSATTITGRVGLTDRGGVDDGSGQADDGGGEGGGNGGGDAENEGGEQGGHDQGYESADRSGEYTRREIT